MSGKYTVYQEYKDSGVEWLGEIPAHWKTCRLKHLASIKNGQDYKAVQSEVGYPVMGSGGQFAFATEFMYDKPSVLLGRKGTIDKPLYINEPFWTVDTMYYTEMQPETDAKYLYYLATTIQFARYSTNTALPSMTQEHLGNYIFAVPVEVSDRTQIANFLDHETAKIDTLIEKQQQLIKLLKEKRQAVISHAVTKGLNPQAPMKDSGVEWLGEVPEHWGLWKFGHFAPIITCGVASTPTYVDEAEGMPFLSAQNIKNNKLSLHKYNYIPHTLHNQLTKNRKPERGDILVTRVGAGIGAACIVDIDMEFSIYVSLTHIRVNPEIANNKFIMYFFGSDYCEFLNQDGTVTGGGVGNLNVQNVVRYKVPLPPLDEQEQIVDAIEKANSIIDKLISTAERAIELAKERRIAVISAAVTGKIDVRNWRASTPQEQALEQPPKPITALV
ncbi:restriction endonuclease subunit S [Vibrio spartinae]|uniref:Type I restriction enzyme EcoKI specificity protein n=1 Tax=Vibrio spartinae TaxID=1918945 RepID=A0ABX6R3D2_9VIBR|nr:restriction endonuclease subunit S [Vibrio spartinae]QMV15672.1 Type I restriction enzyme EcoKI specificity protein [Vibrio spartinae]